MKINLKKRHWYVQTAEGKTPNMLSMCSLVLLLRQTPWQWITLTPLQNPVHFATSWVPAFIISIFQHKTEL